MKNDNNLDDVLYTITVMIGITWLAILYAAHHQPDKPKKTKNIEQEIVEIKRVDSKSSI